MADPSSSDIVPAGPFVSWLSRTHAMLRGTVGSDVPCGDCTGCCTSSYSVQLRPEDGRALAVIPAALLISPVGFPAGHRTMPALADGTCPMLDAGKCSIYRDRPQTCHDYDCRIFAAAGIDAGEAGKGVINRRVRQWRFSYPGEEDRRTHAAVMAAAAFTQRSRDSFPVRVPTSPMGIAVFALKTYTVFLAPRPAESGDREIARDMLLASRQFDANEAYDRAIPGSPGSA